MFEPELAHFRQFGFALAQQHGAGAWIVYRDGAVLSILPPGDHPLDAALAGSPPSGTRLFAKQLGGQQTEQAYVVP